VPPIIEIGGTRCEGGGVLEGALDVLADLLHACRALVLLALGLEVLVVGGVADNFLGLADGVFCCVLGLVDEAHVGPFQVAVNVGNGYLVGFGRRKQTPP